MRHKTGTIFLVGWFLLCFKSFAQASEEERQQVLLLELADSLLREEKSAQAFTIYRDFLELYPESVLRVRALGKIAEIYETRQSFDKAAEVHRRLFEIIGLSESGLHHRLEQARLLSRMGYDERARAVLEEIIFLSPQSEAAAEARNRLLLFRVLPESSSHAEQFFTK